MRLDSEAMSVCLSWVVGPAEGIWLCHFGRKTRVMVVVVVILSVVVGARCLAVALLKDRGS